MAASFLAGDQGRNAAVTIVGRRGRDSFGKQGRANVAGQHVNVPRTIDLARTIARDAAERFLQGEAGEVYLLYTRFRSAISQVTTLDRLLPLRGDEEAENAAAREYVYEPSANAILESLLPRYVETRIYHALLESSASEHGARMTAMDNASRNASEMIDRLTLEMNRARQAGITKELMEIVGGAEALNG
jgi:F-type H+-transporting ATPase subunit gamma